jgi:hypothetical protein
MRKDFARCLRKWADLIDPRVNPTGETWTMRIDVDTTDATATLKALQGELSRFTAHAAVAARIQASIRNGAVLSRNQA